MGSSGKARTTFAKLNRESRLREKRAEKAARKAARKQGTPIDGVDVGPGAEQFEDAGREATPSTDAQASSAVVPGPTGEPA